jgi:hypothetical protein
MDTLMTLLRKSCFGRLHVLQEAHFEDLLLARGHGVSVPVFLEGYGVKLRNYRRDQPAVDPQLLGSMLFKASNLSATEKLLVRQNWQIVDGVDSLLEVLEDIFPPETVGPRGTFFSGNGIGSPPPGDPTLSSLMKELGELRTQVALFQGSGKGGQASPAGGGGKESWCRLCKEHHRYGHAPKCAAEIETEKREGYCRICKGKVGHYTKLCPKYDPNFFRNKGGGTRKETAGWVAFNGGLSSLAQVTKECVEHTAAVVDTGCTFTVMGTVCKAGLEGVLGPLPLHPTDSSYSFGEGEDKLPPVESVGQCAMDFRWGSQTFSVMVDVVPGDLPLLLSKADQIRMDANIRAARGLFEVPGPKGAGVTSVHLLDSTSGHWLLPLRWKVQE